MKDVENIWYVMKYSKYPFWDSESADMMYQLSFMAVSYLVLTASFSMLTSAHPVFQTT